MLFAIKLIALNACPSSARTKFRFKFRRIPCALGRTRRDAQGNAPDTTAYQYDPNGNLTSSQRERADTTTRSYRTESSHNKLLDFSQTSTSGTASTSVTHQYDAAGNLQTDGLRQYHYDSQGRLQSASTGQGEDAPTTRYAHNALGQRVFKTEPLYITQSAKDDGGALDSEEDPGLIERIVQFFTRLWSPKSSDAEKLGWAYVNRPGNRGGSFD